MTTEAESEQGGRLARSTNHAGRRPGVCRRRGDGLTTVALKRWYGTARAPVVVAAVVGVAAVVAAVFVAVPAKYALAGAVLIVGTFAVYRLPVLSLSALVVVGGGPMVFQMTGHLQFDTSVLFGKIRLVDAIMIPMMLSVVLKAALALARPGSRSSNLPVALAACYGALFAWMAVSVLRNLDAYGLGAVGQFRYSYLILVVPAYATIFLRSSAQRRRFCVFLLVFSVAVPLAAMPVIGYLKGWGIGPTSRFFPASLSIGLLYGWAVLLLASERGNLKTPKWLARGLAFPVAIILLVDSHRSVWLAGLVLLAYFLVVLRVSAGAFARMASLTAAVAVSTLALARILGLDIVGYVVSRGSALVNPAGDDTSSWRLDLWTSNLARWRQHPFAGEGLGSYYAANADQGVATTTQPHSYYVQTLVSMGAIGLALFVAVVVVAGAALWNALKQQRNVEQKSLDATLVEAGLGILLSALAYSAVYAVDYYPCLWVGIALAAAMGLRRNEPPAMARSLSRPWVSHALPPHLQRR